MTDPFKEFEREKKELICRMFMEGKLGELTANDVVEICKFALSSSVVREMVKALEYYDSNRFENTAFDKSVAEQALAAYNEVMKGIGEMK